MTPSREDQRELAERRLYRLKLFRDQPHTCNEVVTVIDRMIATVQAEVTDLTSPPSPPSAA